jgi:delta14-sterol reductase
VIGATLVLGASLAPLVGAWFWPLFAAANIFSVGLDADPLRGRSRAGNPPSGGFIKDLWMGVELNPTWRGVDLKHFAYQPSLIGLGLLVAAFGYAQHDQIGHLTPQMIAYQASWWLYLFTHYRDEAGVLSMYDIIAEKFGFMLVWGDLVLVPFFYCIAGWFLLARPSRWRRPAARPASPPRSRRPVDLPRRQQAEAHLQGRPECEDLGRGASAARRAPARVRVVGRRPQDQLHRRAHRVLRDRRAAGLGHIGPFLVPLWLLGLLVHRAWRDEQRCSAKYGALWQEYCRVVPVGSWCADHRAVTRRYRSG